MGLQLPQGSHALCVNTDGLLLVHSINHGLDMLGTSFPTVRANALQILAWQYKENLKSRITSPDMHNHRVCIDAVVQAWLDEQQLEREVQKSRLTDELQDGMCETGAGAAAVQEPDRPASPLESVSFDGVVAAYVYFVQNCEDIDIQGCSAEEVMYCVRDALIGVIVDETEERMAGHQHLADVAAEDLLVEWVAAHLLRQELNHTGAHLLRSPRIARQALDLFDEAADAAHPGLQTITHLAKQASLAARDLIAALERTAQEKRRAHGKAVMTVTMMG